MPRGSGGGGTADGNGGGSEQLIWIQLRWISLCAALAALCLVWTTVAADEAAELDELELVWSAQLTVGLTPAGKALPTPFSARVDSYGYSSFVSMGALTPDTLQWRGETVAVHALGIEASGAWSTLHLNVCTELADNFQLQVGGQRLAVSAGDRPAGDGSGYRWTDVDLNLTTGQTLTVGLARPYLPLTLELSSSRELCTAATLTELSWEISAGQPPYTPEIDGQTVDPEKESHSVNCAPIAVDSLTDEPLLNQTKMFSAVVKDSQTYPDASSIKVSFELTQALPAPVVQGVAPFKGYIGLWWFHVLRAGSLSPINPTAEPDARPDSYHKRYRAAGALDWSIVVTQAPFRDTADIRVDDGDRHFMIAAIRHSIEAETKNIKTQDHKIDQSVRSSVRLGPKKWADSSS